MATACHQSYGWLPGLLKSFAQAWPEVEVTVVAEAASAPYDWLATRRLDVALVAGAPPRDRRVRLARLFRDELVALVGRGHPWFARRRVEVRAFADEHLWADDGALRRDTPLGRALADAGGVAPRKVSLVPSAAGVPIEMARANLGVTICPRWIAEPAAAAGDLRAVRVGPRGLWLDWSVATRDEDPEPMVAAFLDALRAHHPRAGAPARPRSARPRASVA